MNQLQNKVAELKQLLIDVMQQKNYHFNTYEGLVNKEIAINGSIQVLESMIKEQPKAEEIVVAPDPKHEEK